MKFSDEVLDAFPGISVAEGEIRSVKIERESPGLEALKAEVAREIQSRYTLEQVKNEPLFRAYRDFFWSVGVDPTKTRPASEALVRRILSGRKLPTINTAVDAYNLASAGSGVPIAAFDADKLDAGDKYFELKVYQGRPHGFMMVDGSLNREDYATDAYHEMIAFFTRTLK